jgi:ribosomal protein S27AE
MQTDPAQEWRRLTEEYRAMSEVELLHLAADVDDLTEAAKQVLRQEMQSRGMSDPVNVRSAGDTVAVPATKVRWDANDFGAQNPAAIYGSEPQVVPGAEPGQQNASEPHDISWLTYLCESETQEQARQLCEVLRRAKIDCMYKSYGLAFPQIFVAADQLEQARAIAADPIPQEIVDESKEEVPEFVEPKCPKCSAEGPVLESSEEVNRWHCEECDYDWSEPVEAAGANPAGAMRNPPQDGKSRPATGQLLPQGE